MLPLQMVVYGMSVAAAMHSLVVYGEKAVNPYFLAGAYVRT